MSSRRRRRARLPRIPPEVETLRRSRSVVVPWQTYAVELPDGRVMRWSGAELIATADAFVALADAQEAGDLDGVRRAVLRIANDGGMP